MKIFALILAAALTLMPLTACTYASKPLESKKESKIQNAEKRGYNGHKIRKLRTCKYIL